MKTYQTLLVGLAFLAFAGCKDPDTKAFSQVVGTFGLSIPDEPHAFVVLPINSCTMCVKLAWDVLESETAPSKSITVIDAYRRGKDPFRKEVSYPVFMDSVFAVENSPIMFTNPTVVRTEKGKVISIVSTPTNKVEETLRKELDSQ